MHDGRGAVQAPSMVTVPTATTAQSSHSRLAYLRTTLDLCAPD
jgi:hypothetical protein